MFGYFGKVEKEKSEIKRKWKFNVEIFTLFDVKMIQIWTFPADPSTERVPSLAERVAYLRHPINLRLFNWRVPALLHIHFETIVARGSRTRSSNVAFGP